AHAAAFGETFDGLDPPALHLHSQGRTRKTRFIVDEYSAGAALAPVASLLGAGQSGYLAQVIQQQHAVWHQILTLAAVNGQGQDRFHRPLSPQGRETIAENRSM